MYSIVLLLLVLVFRMISSTNAYADACTDLRVGQGGGSILVACVIQQQKQISELIGQNTQQANDILRLIAQNTQQANDILKLKGEADVHEKLLAGLLPLSQGNFAKKIDDVTKRLFGDVDSVYTIAADYNLDSKEFKPTLVYIYADPTKHDIRAVVYPHGVVRVGGEPVPPSFDFIVNKRYVYKNATKVDEDITDKFKFSLQGSGGGGREESKEGKENQEGTDLAMAYPPFVQLIEIRPHIPGDTSKSGDPLRKGQSVSLQGYILVSRRSEFSARGREMELSGRGQEIK
jgi:hypothetical protein